MIRTKRCSKGHSYDSGMFSFCPVCAGANMPGADFSFNPSGNAGGAGLFEDIGATTPLMAPFIPETPSGGWNLEPDDTMPPQIPSGPAPFLDDYEPTAPMVIDSGASPVVGWLVCIEGPEKGADYKIKMGYNYIGRNASMDICIRGDNAVTGDKNAVIIFDDEYNEFFFAHQNGARPVRLNGKMVAFATQINAYDVLSIGRSKFLFIPFCGERFSWNETE